MRFQGKAAVVVGGAGAIGGTIAKALAAKGCAIALMDIVPSRETAAAITASGQRAVEFPTDITNAEKVLASMNAATAALGGLDILVNAAGVVSAGPAATLSSAEWDRVIAINLKGAFLCCQAAIAPLRQRGGGRIINIGSVLGKNGGNARPWIDASEQSRSGNVAYGVSKAGVHCLTAYLARELASARITVNAVAPGPIATAMTTNFPDTLKSLIPLGRLGRPEEVAAIVLFLASEEAGFITGEVVDVNGGSWSD
jgi:3-oxoacyl-[acyl-carrier protein] reductase